MAVKTKTLDAIIRLDRVVPPVELGEAEMDIWQRVTETFAADYFSQSDADILLAYCRHMATADWLYKVLKSEMALNDIDLDAIDKASKLHERETRAASSLATRLKITKQATTNHRGNEQPKKKQNPWSRPNQSGAKY